MLCIIKKLFFITSMQLHAMPLYFCTAATSNYYKRLLNLIGSIHKTNFQDLQQIAVFDLGLTEQQKNELKHLCKVVVYDLEKTHPDILKLLPKSPGYPGTVPGWYAWKPVAIKQSLEKFPYVLWVDAGTTILQPLTNLFKHIQQNGYFLCTISGDPNKGQRAGHNVGWCTTNYVVNMFNMHAAENKWILEKECVMGGIIGVTREAAHLFIMPLYELSKDLRNYQDDGTAAGGTWSGRHDQPLLSILAYSQYLTVFEQDSSQQIPMELVVDSKKEPLYITWAKNFVCDKTAIWSSRSDINHELLNYIRRDNV